MRRTAMKKHPFLQVFAFDGHYRLFGILRFLSAVCVNEEFSVLGDIQRLFIAARVAGCAEGEFFIYGGCERVVDHAVDHFTHILHYLAFFIGIQPQYAVIVSQACARVNFTPARRPLRRLLLKNKLPCNKITVGCPPPACKVCAVCQVKLLDRCAARW